jgi:glucan-binding YG repeat protein
VKNTSSSSSSSSDTNLDSAYLYDIVLDYGEINFSKSTKSYDINVPTAIDEIRIKAKPEEDDYDVTIDDTTVDEEDKWAETVSLEKGKNVIEIEVVDNDENKRIYTLNIYRGTTSSDANTSSNGTVGPIDNKQDSIYLDDLILDDGDTKLNFNHQITSYAIDYKESYEYILIKSEPEDSDNIVRINGNRVETDNYVSKIDLKKGKNVLKIQVDNSNDYDTDEEDYEKRIYTLTIYRGTSEGTATGATSNNSGSNNANVNATIKVNQWVSNNGKWQYNDILGHPLKNMWFLDKNYGAWYYLDEIGNMRTGWLKDGSGNWYYLYPSGAMAYNTIIEGYKLGANGAWIK